jgi:prolyl-tRNA synthetase
MKQSKLFTKTQKDALKNEASVNAQLLIRAGFVDKLMAGVYSFLPLGQCVMKKIEQIIRKEMNAIGGQEVFMPTLHPKENWLKTGRWDTMNDLYKVKDASGKEFALGPTHEEIVVPLAQKYVNSYRDFPFYVYQFQNKFRMELRAKSGILRGREFIMKDLYSFHLDKNDFSAYYEKVAKSYENIFQRIGIGEKTYKTFASGGSFSKYSHEYQTVTSAGEDLIYICSCCGLAINEEIKKETKVCPSCKGGDFRREKAIEVGNIFNLKNKFTKPFNFNIKDERGEKKEVIMGCYGIGLSRLMGTIAEVFHDEKGIVWPETVAPFQFHLISLGRDDETEKIYQDMIKKGEEVLYDDRDETAGKKFADSDLIGIPYRVVVSEKSLRVGGIEIKKRNEKESKIVKIKDFAKQLMLSS